MDEFYMPTEARGERSLFALLGGLSTLRRVHKLFYDKLYADRWLNQFFTHIDQAVIENQQTDFMAQAMGGPEAYCGKFPVSAHKHMYITAEMFDARHELLAASLREAAVQQDLAERWLRIDAAFRSRLVKNAVADCVARYRTEEIVVISKPHR